MDTLVYNTQKKKLIIPEYGRHIHDMIDQAVALKDKEKRNEMAKAIIGVMGNLNPHLRDVPDFQHKLWAQLFIMSDFQLDVESPYDKPSKEVYEKAQLINREYVIQISGVVLERESKNPEIVTGSIEVLVEKLNILNINTLNIMHVFNILNYLFNFQYYLIYK